MVLYDTNQCGVKEITGLRDMSSAEGAMVEFCEKVLGKPPKYKSATYSWNMGQLYCFYLFTAALTGGREYGAEFADFIKEEKLGVVVATKPVQNLAFHPEHKNQAWLWTPDTPKLVAWYQGVTGKKSVVVKEAE